MTLFERVTVAAELTLLAAALLVTTLTGWAVYAQTKEHFILQRTSYMIERFNEEHMVKARAVTDSWLEKKEAAKSLLDLAVDPAAQKPESQKTQEEKSGSERAARAEEVSQNVRVFCNFFQELGTAMKHNTLDEEYMWDVFGAAVIRYGEELKPYIEELRDRRGRPGLYQEFYTLVDRMRELDKKYGQPDKKYGKK